MSFEGVGTTSGYWDATTLPPNRYDGELQLACSMAKEALSASVARPWTPRSVQQGVSIFTRPCINSSLQEIKGVAILASSPLLLHALFSDMVHRVKWDPMVESSRDLEDIDRLTHIAYAMFKAPWPVSKREVIVLGRSQREPDGSFLSYAISIPYDTLPVSPGSVRAKLVYSTVMVTPLVSGRDAGKCRVTFASCSDPLGHLPHMLVDATSVRECLDIQLAATALEEQPALRAEIQCTLSQSMNVQGFTEEAASVMGGGVGAREKTRWTDASPFV